MSHTTEVKSVPVKDIHALRAAVAELKKQGLSCELVEKQAPRMYYPNQFQKSTNQETADYCLKLPGKYDIGFVAEYKTTKSGKTLERYNIVFDNWNNEVSNCVGYPKGELSEDQDQHLGNIGKLAQLYTKHATINAAKKQGYNVRSAKTDANGNIQLVLAGI